MTYTVQPLDPTRDELPGHEHRQERHATGSSPTTSPTRAATASAACASGFEPLAAGAAYRLYVRFDPTVNGNGGGGAATAAPTPAPSTPRPGHPCRSPSDTDHDRPTPPTATTRSRSSPRSTRQPFPRGHAAASPAPASDGLTQLDARARARPRPTPTPRQRQRRADGAGRPGRRRRDLTLALGFGATQADGGRHRRAPRCATGFGRRAGSYARRLGRLRRRAQAAAGDAARACRTPRARELRGDYYLSANVLKASEDKTFPGAIVASLASPWGQAVSAGDPNNTYFGSYREVFARDLYETFTGLAGRRRPAPPRATRCGSCSSASSSPTARCRATAWSTASSRRTRFGTQLDEVAYPILMAWQLGLTDARAATPTTSSGRPTSSSATGPRSARSAGRSRAASRRRRSPPRSPAWSPRPTSPTRNGDRASARVCRGVGRRLPALDQGLDGDHERPARRRPLLHPAVQDRRPERGHHLQRRQRRADARPARGDRRRLPRAAAARRAAGRRPRRRSRSLPVVDATIRRDTASGPGWHRYNGDGYGDRDSDGRPWAPTGQGNGPPLAGAVRRARRAAHRRLGDRGDRARGCSTAMRRFASGVGLIPEQDWENPDLAASPFGTDPTSASIGFVNGKPVGSAVAADLVGGAVRPAGRATSPPAGCSSSRPTPSDRYVTTRSRPTDAHGDRAGRPDAGDRLAGHRDAARRRPGNTVDVAATNIDADSADDRRHHHRRAPTARFSVDVPVDRRDDRARRGRHQPPTGAHRARAAHRRVRLRARHAAARRRPTRTATTTGPATTPTRRRPTSSRAPTTSSASRSSTTAPTSSSGCRPAT